MKGILGLIYLILCIYVTLDCVKSSKSGGQKVIWLLVIWLIPYAGAIIYYVAGRK